MNVCHVDEEDIVDDDESGGPFVETDVVLRKACSGDGSVPSWCSESLALERASRGGMRRKGGTGRWAKLMSGGDDISESREAIDFGRSRERMLLAERRAPSVVGSREAARDLGAAR